MKKYYHLTTKDKLPKILETGLVPMLGKNSKLTEKEELLFLCGLEDVPFWNIIIESDVLLEISELDIKVEEFEYEAYKEYITKQSIPVDNIKVIDMPESKTALDILRNSYIRSISFAIVSVVRSYDIKNGRNIMYKDIQNQIDFSIHRLSMYFHTMRKLKYEEYDKEKIRRCIKEYGEDGEYALTDMYLDTELRLYQRLRVITDEKTKELRDEVYNFITDKFEDCLDINTGGYTGP